MGRILEYINKARQLIMGLTKKATAYLKDIELIVALVCAAAGEVVVYLIILELNHLQIEFPHYIRFPNPIEMMSLIVAIPLSIFFGLVGSILFSRYRFNRKFGQNLEHLSEVNKILSREDGTPNKYLPYKMIVSKIFLGSKLSDKVTSLSHGLSVNTGEFASIIELFLDNLEKNYTDSVYIYSTCTLTPKRYMQDDLKTYRKKWEEFGAKFTLKNLCPRFVRLILPDFKRETNDIQRLKEYNVWEEGLQQEISSFTSDVNAFITWNKENCFELCKLSKPYPQTYYGVEFNPPPVNDFMIIAEGSEDKPKGHVIIGGWQDHSIQNNFYIKYEKEAARLEHYCEYFDFLKSNSKRINALSDLG